MTEKEFMKIFNKALDFVDNEMDSKKTYDRIINDILNDRPNDEKDTHMMQFIQTYENERTNNLVRIVLKNLLVNE